MKLPFMINLALILKDKKNTFASKLRLGCFY